MRSLALIVVLGGLLGWVLGGRVRADVSVPANIAGPHRLAGPIRSLARYCAARGCEGFEYATCSFCAPAEPVGSLLDWRLLTFPRQKVSRVALRTRRGWFVDEQGFGAPEGTVDAGRRWLEPDGNGARMVVMYEGPPWHGIIEGNPRGSCYARKVQCQLGEQGAPECYAAANLAITPQLADFILCNLP